MKENCDELDYGKDDFKLLKKFFNIDGLINKKSRKC